MLPLQILHVLIGKAARVRRPLGVGSVVLSGLVLAILALGVSAQAIATAIGGQSALSAELAQQVEPYAHALNEAHAQATWFAPLAGVAAASAASYAAMAEQEASGQLGAGAGCGPRCAEMLSFASNFRSAEADLRGQLAEAEVLQASGEAALGNMRLAVANADQESFMRATQGVASSVTALNALDPSATITTMGVVTVDASRDVSFDAQTGDFREEAARLGADRERIAVPTFVPLSIGEATRAQMFKAALHAWIAAGAIDVLPFLFLLLVLTTSREPLLRDAAPRRVRTSFEEENGRVVHQEGLVARGSRPHLVAGE